MNYIHHKLVLIVKSTLEQLTLNMSPTKNPKPNKENEKKRRWV
jgi:hypothetical protein